MRLKPRATTLGFMQAGQDVVNFNYYQIPASYPA